MIRVDEVDSITQLFLRNQNKRPSFRFPSEIKPEFNRHTPRTGKGSKIFCFEWSGRREELGPPFKETASQNGGRHQSGNFGQSCFVHAARIGKAISAPYTSPLLFSIIPRISKTYELTGDACLYLRKEGWKKKRKEFHDIAPKN